MSHLETRTPGATIRLLCHFAFWFGLVFATPVFVALHNIGDIGLDPGRVALFAVMATLLLSVATWSVAALTPPRLRQVIDRAVLVLAVLLATWGNVIHDLHGFPVFDGRPVDFRRHEVLFWLESLAWPIGAVLFFRWFGRVHRIPVWLPALPLLSFVLLLAPAVLRPPQAGLQAAPSEPVDASVYAFSSVFNLVHLLPDGFQGDTVRRTFEDHPELAARFDGFTLYTDHLGRYPGTAPSLYSMLTGAPFPLERGFAYSWVGPETRENAYPTVLARQGFRVDMVPISDYICPDEADSCHPRPFKNHGLAGDRARGRNHALWLLADLTLFRLAPVNLKERIYDRGYWLLSDIAAGEGAPVPDPVLREWAENLRVIDDRPVYKWHHYVGTHVPPHWDASCDLRRGLEPIAANYRAQAYCVLDGLARFFERLQAVGIWSQTAILISGDHGHNTIPDDQVDVPLNAGMYEPLLGTARPALMVKPAGASGPLVLSRKPTHLLHVRNTALALAGLPYEGPSVFEVADEMTGSRVFQHYPIDRFWSGEPIPYLAYSVGQPANNASLWKVSDMAGHAAAPSAYRPVNRKTARGYLYGAELRRSLGHAGASWVRGRQLAFLIDIPAGGEPAQLAVELAFEPWMAEQSFTVRINGGSPWHSGPVETAAHDGAFRAFKIPVSPSDQRPGPDFVSILFERLHANPEKTGERAAARVRDVVATAGG